MEQIGYRKYEGLSEKFYLSVNYHYEDIVTQIYMRIFIGRLHTLPMLSEHWP